jgi:hypothetical protein
MRRQLKVAFMTMMKGTEDVSYEGRLDLKDGGQQERPISPAVRIL